MRALSSRPAHVPVQYHIAYLLPPLSLWPPERALSALDCFGDRCNTAVGLDEYGTASYLGAHVPLILTEIAAPASSLLPINIQVTPSPPSGSIILLLRQGGHSHCTKRRRRPWSGQPQPPEKSKAELEVGAVWLERARREAPAASSGIRGCIASHQIAPHRIEPQRSLVQCSAVQFVAERLRLRTRGARRRNPGVGFSGSVMSN